jgi:hypothetical protein
MPAIASTTSSSSNVKPAVLKIGFLLCVVTN